MFAIIIIVELILVDGFAILEHPAEPLHDPLAASIWRLPILRAPLRFVQCTGFENCAGFDGCCFTQAYQSFSREPPRAFVNHPREPGKS